MTKLVASAHAASERANSRFSHHPEAYHRFNVDQLHPSTASSPASVAAASRAYLACESVNQQMDDLILLMSSRSSTIAVEDLGRPKPGSLARDVKQIPVATSTYDNLKTLPYAERASFNPDLVCLKGTRVHILTVIYHWMQEEGEKPALLWLEGVFGAGKSFTAHSVAKEAHRLGILGSSFFMTPGTGIREGVDQKSASEEPPSLRNIVTSLIVDLGGLSDPFRWAVGKILKEHPRLATATPSVQLTELLLPSLSSLCNDRAFLWVIDGFDELMRYSDRDAADRFFETLCSSLPSFPPNFIVFITSRPLTNHPLPLSPAILHLVLDLSSAENIQDIGLISYAELEKLAASNQAFSIPPPRDHLAESFRRKAEGHPLWLRVTREYLRTSLNPNEELKELINLDRSGFFDYHQFMDSTYAYVIARSIDLGNSSNRKALKHVILVFLSLQRPLPFSTLLNILEGSTELPAKTFSTVTSYLRPLLLGFNTPNPIEFLHLSLRDFFASSRVFSDLIQDVPPPRDLSLGHFTLLQCSFQVMQTYLRPEKQVDEYPHDHPALRYVAGSWPNHLTSLNSTIYGPPLGGALSRFLDKSFIPWLDYHTVIGIPFLFTQAFLEQAKGFDEDIWNEKVFSQRQIPKKLDVIQGRFKSVGRLDDWRLCSNQAVDLWRILAGSSAKGQRHLYFSMLHKATGLTELGLNEDALTTHREALALCRSLDQQDCQQFKSADLAWLLSGYSGCLSQVGCHEEALAAIEEAVSLRRELVHERPKVEADLARSLTKFSVALSNVGRHSEALIASEAAVTLYRKLVGQHPGIHDADLARSLSNLCIDFLTLVDMRNLIPPSTRPYRSTVSFPTSSQRYSRKR
ncbi:hypothetical protein DL96DRAFT_1639608 [Flagelloscypha sp. PMI_526]|nr:hypothetical protein DL96DRAFT_1639608 [Flagelloscypha sp. PMI_526]